MTFLLHVDAPRWRAHQDRVRLAIGTAAGETERMALVPVIKGNGYGLGAPVLGAEAERLGAGTVAVGTVHEVPEVAAAFPGDLLVLEPYEPRDALAAAAWARVQAGPLAARLVRTVASVDGVRAAVAQATPDRPVRCVVEGLTSVRRFGMDEPALVAAVDDPRALAALADGALLVEGLALHLPLAPAQPSAVDQVIAWARRWSGLRDRLPDPSAPGMAGAAQLWVSHLYDDALASVRGALPALPLRPRVGTRLWLGDRGALRPRGTVLAVHPYDDTVAVGYRQRTGPRDGTLIVVSGGTSHGVALQAAASAVTARQRVVAAGTGALEAAGRALSPFHWAGRQRWFAEAPHMHVSLLWLPRGCIVPAVGDELDCELRFVTARFDLVTGLD